MVAARDGARRVSNLAQLRVGVQGRPAMPAWGRGAGRVLGVDDSHPEQHRYWIRLASMSASQCQASWVMAATKPAPTTPRKVSNAFGIATPPELVCWANHPLGV